MNENVLTKSFKIYSWQFHKAWFQYNIYTFRIIKGMCHYNHKFSIIRSCICQYMNIWCNLIFRIDGGLQGGDEGKHLCFYCSFYKPPRTRLLSCYCSGSKFTSFHYVWHNDNLFRDLLAFEPCQSTVSWLTRLIQTRSVSSFTLKSVLCDKINYFSVRQWVRLRNEGINVELVNSKKWIRLT